MTRLFPVFFAALVAGTTAHADGPATYRSLSASPEKLTIRGADDAPQLLVTGTTEANRPVDLTGDVAYAVQLGPTSR